MARKKKQEWISFTEDGQRWMICKVCQLEYVQVERYIAAVTCSSCVMKKCLVLKPLDTFFASKKPKTGRPAGWHWMTEFVDKDGNVFHKGKEQTELKGTLKPTKVKARKKKKKLTGDEKLYKTIRDYKKRKKGKK